MTNCARFVAIATTLVASLVARAAPAQPVADRASAPRARLAALPPGSYVRTSVGGVRAEGRMLGVPGDTLMRLGFETGATLDVPVALVDTVWTRHGDARGVARAGGGFIGASIGVLAFLGFAAAGADAGGALALGMIAGGLGVVGGAVLGGAAGSLNQRWRRVIP